MEDTKIVFKDLKPDEASILKQLSTYFDQNLLTQHDKILISETLQRAIKRVEKEPKMLKYKLYVFKPDTKKYYTSDDVLIPAAYENPDLVSNIEQGTISFPYGSMLRLLIPDPSDIFHPGYPRLIMPRK